MNRFYFHVRQGDWRFHDAVGWELSGLVAAWEHAIQDARRLSSEQVLAGPTDQHWIEIGDETGAVVASLSFRHDSVALR